MGMFDTVYFHCPCGGVKETQTKAGERVLLDYHVRPGGQTDVPLNVLDDVMEHSPSCPDCGREFRVAAVVV